MRLLAHFNRLPIHQTPLGIIINERISYLLLDFCDAFKFLFSIEFRRYSAMRSWNQRRLFEFRESFTSVWWQRKSESSCLRAKSN